MRSSNFKERNFNVVIGKFESEFLDILKKMRRKIEILCCGAVRQTSSMSSREAVNINPEFTIRKGIFKLVKSGVIVVGSIFPFGFPLINERLERESKRQ